MAKQKREGFPKRLYVVRAGAGAGMYFETIRTRPRSTTNTAASVSASTNSLKREHSSSQGY